MDVTNTTSQGALLKSAACIRRKDDRIKLPPNGGPAARAHNLYGIRSACAVKGGQRDHSDRQEVRVSPNAIKVKKGDHIRLLITTLDRDRGVKLKAFHIDENLPTGEAVTVEVTADLVGAFPFECSRFCGLGHKHMRGHLIVE
jgi:heme/copper-type cytochrome/quinol oxidase subunit 2